MKKNFLYLSFLSKANASTAVKYYFYNAGSMSADNCYYYHYDPVKGYTFSYHQGAAYSWFSKNKLELQFRQLVINIFFPLYKNDWAGLAGLVFSITKGVKLCRY
ncbi:MAG: hypothetical protein RLZZ28_1753 [Bacteroidota bacterium]|jgi:hypothetical protein